MVLQKEKAVKYIKVRKKQRSEIDTTMYHTLHRTPYGKVTKTQENITYMRVKRSAFFQRVATRLQRTDKTVLQRQTQKTNNKKDPQKKRHLGRVSKKINNYQERSPSRMKKITASNLKLSRLS